MTIQPINRIAWPPLQPQWFGGDRGDNKKRQLRASDRLVNDLHSTRRQRISSTG
jgi:hypothetical protein